MSKIKRDFSKVAAVAEASPTVEDRIQHARGIMGAHPSPEEKAVEDTGSKEPRLVKAPIELIDENPFNARTIYRPERIKELAASIRAHGQDVPGIATIRNGRYVLAAGHYRRKAILASDIQTMDLLIHEGLTDKQLYEFSYRENAEREGQSALDNATSWSRLMKEGVYKGASELAAAVGISEANISKTLKILELPGTILDIVKEEPTAFPLSALYELALLANIAPHEAMGLVIQLKNGEIGRKEIQEARQKLSDPRERKRKETSRAYKLHHDGEEIGAVKVWDSGRIMLDVNLGDKSRREEIVGEITRLFEPETSKG
jgi:ParB family chromosome partitioning protein